MSGIYIHIPFCKQACHYCNFHFSTSLKYKDEMVSCILKEIDLRKDYLQNTKLTSIYFGGGTPSLLNKSDLQKVFDTLSKYFTWDTFTEITLEANPDDLSKQKLKDLWDIGINRLSIGIQSFHQEDLTFMNRAHNADEAEKAILLAHETGFDNITADLIYGAPSTSNEIWQKNIEKMLSFNIPHISAYCLTVEPGTALHHFITTGKAKPVDEEKASEQFNILISTLQSEGYEHYEISNFAQPNNYAVHNTNYWMGKPYLGIGPSAHSFNGNNERSWNISHNARYMKHLSQGKIPLEIENLTRTEQFNEFILIRLRTKWGIDMKVVQHQYPEFAVAFERRVQHQKKYGLLIENDEVLTLSSKGKHLADRISMELFTD